jgi:hypothetical protein
MQKVIAVLFLNKNSSIFVGIVNGYFYEANITIIFRRDQK